MKYYIEQVKNFLSALIFHITNMGSSFPSLADCMLVDFHYQNCMLAYCIINFSCRDFALARIVCLLSWSFLY